MKNNLLKAGLAAGSLDILFAFVNAGLSSGVLPDRVLRFVASGLIGEKAFQDSAGVAFLGLGIHFFIAFFWTVVFFLLYPKFKNIFRSELLQAAIYGIFVWLIMNLVVLPLTNAPKLGFQWLDVAKGILILIIAIGFPLVYFARQYYKSKTTESEN